MSAWEWLPGLGYRKVRERDYPGLTRWDRPQPVGPSGDPAWLEDVFAARRESSGDGPQFFRSHGDEELEEIRRRHWPEQATQERQRRPHRQMLLDLNLQPLAVAETPQPAPAPQRSLLQRIFRPAPKPQEWLL